MIATWNTWNKAITNEFKQSMGEQKIRIESPQKQDADRRKLDAKLVISHLFSVDTSMEPNSLSDHDTTLIAGYD